jgi:hypothetical protein
MPVEAINAALRTMGLLGFALLIGCSCQRCDPPRTEEFSDIGVPHHREDLPIELAHSRSALPLVPAQVEVELGRNSVSVEGTKVVEIVDGRVAYEGDPLTTWAYHIRPIWEPVEKRSRALEAAEGNHCCDGPWGIATVATHRDTSFGLLMRVLSTIGQSRLISYQAVVEAPNGERRGLRLCTVRYDSGCSRCWRDHWERTGWREPPSLRPLVVLSPIDEPDAGATTTPGRRPLTVPDSIDEPDAGAESSPFLLMLLIQSDGFLLITTPPRLPGSEEDTGRIHIPLLSSGGASFLPESDPNEPCAEIPEGDRFDLAALRRHLVAIKGRHPRQLSIFISACQWENWGELVSTIDVVQGGPEEKLFPLVVLLSGI